MTTEAEPARDEATGRFKPSTEGLYGREYEQVSNGFSVKKDAEPDESIDSIDPVRQAAADLAARRAAPENLSVVELKNMADFEPKEARTVQEAGAEYAQSVKNVSKFAEGLDLSRLGDEVDTKRLEAIGDDKAKAKHFGFELEDKPAVKDDAQPAEGQVDADTAAAIDAVEGLDEPTRQALKLPAVRAAIEAQLGEVDTARQQLATERVLARQFAQANLDAELAGIPSTQQEAWLQQVAQQDPSRFQRIMGTLDRVQQIQVAEQQAQQAQAQEQRAQIEAWAKNQDARLKSLGVEFTPEAANAVVEYAREELAIDRNQLAEVMLAHPILRSAQFQRVMHDAAQYRRIKAAPKAVPEGLPKVQRPGLQQDRPRPEAANIAGLQKQLESAQGNRALVLAAKIKSAQRKARG